MELQPFLPIVFNLHIFLYLRGLRGPRSSWRSNRSFKVCVNREGVIEHSFLTKTVSLVFNQNILHTLIVRCVSLFYHPKNLYVQTKETKNLFRKNNRVIQTYRNIKIKLPLHFCMNVLIIMIGQLGIVWLTTRKTGRKHVNKLTSR